ncbi:MAG: hypothetical protein ACYDB1_00705 [Acidiferrobacteraceae bacterium]
MHNRITAIRGTLKILLGTFDELLTDCEDILNNIEGLSDPETRFLIEIMNVASDAQDKIKELK